MKKIMALLLALVLAMGLVACASDGNADESSTPPEGSSAPEESEGKNLDRDALPYRQPMSDTVKYMIEDAWKNSKNEDIVWFDEYADELDDEAMRYYGLFGDDYLILFNHVGWNLEYGCNIEIAGSDFAHKAYFELYAYKDGIFYELEAVYETGGIEFPEIMIIADIHAKFEQYIKKYS